MKKWEITYRDNTCFSNLDGVWEDAPRDNVLCVTVPHADGKGGFETIKGYDQYILIEHPEGIRVYACSMKTVWVGKSIQHKDIPCDLFTAAQIKRK